MKRPPDDLSALDVARPEGQASAAAGRGDDGIEVVGQVRSVGIHLHEERHTFGQADPKSILIGAAEAQLPRPVEHAHTSVCGGQLIGQLACTVRGAVVDDEDMVAEPSHAGHHFLEVLALVVCGQYDEHLVVRRLLVRLAHRLNLTRTTCLNMSSELRTAMTLVGAECRHTTGTSAILVPRRLAR